MKLTSCKITPVNTRISRIRLLSDANAEGSWVIDHDLQTMAESLFSAALAGQDPRATAFLWRNMLDHAGDNLQARICAAALDVALWDLKSVSGNEPLWRKIGGARKPANIHFSIGGCATGSADEDRRLHKALSTSGFREGRLDSPLDADDLPLRIERLASALADDAQPPALYVNAREQGALKDAIASIRTLEQRFDITGIEAPCPMWDASGVRKVSENIRAAVFNDLSAYGRERLLPLFRAQSLNIVQLSIFRDGVSGVLELADAAFGYELPIIIAAAPGNIGAHFAGALPYFMSLEIAELPEAQTLPSDIAISDGWALPGDAPGLGVNWPQPSI
ncbi:enolase C-terminal domain-like protein [Hyphococcus sp.]|uniref:enolase C-terminal domain-like protein n=1 Tax=Hyphococcus sp. TaxID=2038636 RepID=UPI0035C6C07B